VRRIGLVLVVTLALALVIGCETRNAVTGTLTYREDVALPSEGVMVSVKVEDTSKADVAAVTIGEQVIENPAQQVPIPFEVTYDPSDIDERNTYAIRVRIEVDGKLWFLNTSAYQVITRGSPSDGIEVVLEKVG